MKSDAFTISEMVEGYRDGADLDIPYPSANRSHSYRHGFAVRRAEVEKRAPLADAPVLRAMAEAAIEKDAGA